MVASIVQIYLYSKEQARDSPLPSSSARRRHRAPIAMPKWQIATTLESKADYHKWLREITNLLKSEGLWKVATGDEERPDPDREVYEAKIAVATEGARKWDLRLERVEGIVGMNVSDVIGMDLGERNGIEMLAYLRSEYGRRAEEELHIEWKALQNHDYEDGDDMEEYLRIFQDHINTIASLGRRLSEAELYTTLKANLSPSFRPFLRNLGPEFRTYRKLREELLDEYVVVKKQDERKAYRTRKALATSSTKSSATVTPSTKPKSGKDVLLHASGPLEGQPVVCFKNGCGGNHYKSIHRGETKPGATESKSDAKKSSKPTEKKKALKTKSAEDPGDSDASEDSGPAESGSDVEDITSGMKVARVLSAPRSAPRRAPRPDTSWTRLRTSTRSVIARS